MNLKYVIILLLILINVKGFSDYYMDEKGSIKAYIQKNGENGFSILNEYGQIESFIQENGENNFSILDGQGYLKGFYHTEE